MRGLRVCACESAQRLWSVVGTGGSVSGFSLEPDRPELCHSDLSFFSAGQIW